MMLLLDVGNSRLKWACVDDAGLRFGGAVAHAGVPATAVKAIEVEAVQSVWIANVTGANLGYQLAASVETRYEVEPQFAVVRSEHAGLRIAYADPMRLGIDRWLCLLAAWSETRGPACVASAGTALTFDAVDADGLHLGGVIAPGLLTMQQAVLGATRFAAGGPAQDYDESLGRDTEACVRQGALHAGAGLVERLGARYGKDARCLLTGGDAQRLLPHLGGDWSLRPNLVMEGLLAYARNT